MMLEHSALIRVGLPLIMLISSIAMFWAAADLTHPDYSKLLYMHPNIYSNVTGDTLFFGQSNALFGSVVGATIGLLTSLMGFGGAYTRNRILYGIFVFFGWISALALIVSGALFLNSLPYLGGYQNLEQILQNPNESLTPLSPAHTSMLDFGISIFNECCANRSYTDQSFIKVCTGSNEKDCPAIGNPIVSKFVNPPLLCTCAHSSNSLQMYTTQIKEWKLCDVMSKVYINVGDVQLPQVKETLKKLISQTNSAADLTHVPLVGFHDDPATFKKYFPNAKARDEPKYGYGCGSGYVKGLLFYMNVWYQNNMKPIAYGSIVIGCIEVLALCVVFL